MGGNFKKIILLAVVVALVALFFALDVQHYLSLEFFKSKQQAFVSYYTANKLWTVAAYMAVYVAVTALSLPGAAVMTLGGGALFGFWVSLVAVSFASTIGATLAFLVARFLLRDTVQGKFGDKLRTVNDGIQKEGAFYLFTLRLVPVFPFFVINLVMGLTPMKTAVFYLVSQLGMLPGTAVYVNAGVHIGKIESLQGILSPGLMLSFVLLGIFPLAAKRTVAMIQSRKVYAGFARPRKFDYNLVVVGAGSAGLVTAYIAAAVRAKVALVEKDKMGGDCLNTGCVPSKALIRSAKILSYARRAEAFGFNSVRVDYDFSRVMERVQETIRKIEPHDSAERYTDLGVECIAGEAKITSPYTVEVGGRVLKTRSIVVATGARPFVPPISGIEKVEYRTSDNIWELRRLPERLVVLGGGPIGCEMTQAFARLGSRVTQVEMAPRIMGREDEDVSGLIREKFESEGIRVLVGHRAKEIRNQGDQKVLICEHDGRDVPVAFDEILVAVGRVPNTKGFGLEEIGVAFTPRGLIDTDPYLRTNFPNIYCAGDVVGSYQFTHTAAHQAWFASVNALFGFFKSFKVDNRVIPWATFTEPEVARVGLNIQEAVETGTPHEVTKYPLGDLDRAITDSEDHGFVRVLTRPGSDKILGVTIVGPHAGDIVAEYILAMKHGLGLNKILGTIHIYPTLSEANKYAAGQWKKDHAPEKLLRKMEWFHRRRRG